MNLKAVLYLRISDEKQKENTSLETQEAVSRAYCQTQKYDVVDTVTNEAISAKKTNMQRVIELLDYCKRNQGKFDVLVVFNLSRFARSQEHHHMLRSKLLQMKICLRSASERIDESPTGKLIEGVLASVNEYDNDIRIEKTKLSMIQRLREGLWPWSPPVGYYLPQVPGVRLSVAEKDPGMCGAIRQTFELYATGMYTYSSLAQKLNKQHLVNHRKLLKRFTTAEVEKMIKNPFYSGFLKSSIDDFDEHEGKHEPIISRRLWESCLLVKSGRGGKGMKILRKRTSDTFYLRGLLHSPHLHKYTAASSRGNGGKYGYYFCLQRDCGNHKAETVHDQFLNLLEEIQPAEEEIKLYFEIFAEKIESTYMLQEDEAKRLLFVIETLKQKKATLMEMRMNHEVDSVDFVDQKDKLNAEIVEIETQINTHRQSNAEWKDVIEYGKSYITDIRGRCESLKDVEKKVAYIGSIFPRGLVYNGNFLSNQQTLEVISSCNALKRASVTPWRIELQFPG